MAIAEELGVVALGALWWDAAYSGGDVRRLAVEEMVRQGAFLTSAWDGQSKELLVAIGDGRNESANPPALFTYSDFGDASRAFAIGPPPEDDEFGPQTPVNPGCTYADPQSPAADVAAHAAAALALGTMAVRNMTAAPAVTEGWLEAAEEMFAWSQELSPPSGRGTNAQELKQAAVEDVDTRVGPNGEPSEFGISEIYGIESASDVYGHQFWAACALYQATGKQEHWRNTMQLYSNWINAQPNARRGISRLFFPVPNFDNPVFYGILCMAQSSPTATGIEEKSQLDLTGLANSTSRRDLLLSQEPEPGTRLEVLAELWTQFVSKWIRVTAPVTTTPAENQAQGEPALRYAVIGQGEETARPANGMFRNSANAAWISAMFADLPGVSKQQASLARCMALQTMEFILGKNPAEISFQVGVGTEFPKSPWHKDAACPDQETRGARFERYFRRGTKDPETNHTQSFLLPIQCNFLTFQGNDTANATFPGGVMNPTLPNAHELTGALVSHYNPVGEPEFYTDLRAIGERLPGKTRNDQAQVALDYNAALANLAASLAMMPQSFYATACPSIEQMQQQLQADLRQQEQEEAAAQERLSG